MALPTALDVALLRRTLGPESFWGVLQVLRSTGSTNADLVALSETGAPEGTVVATDHQTAGRGRLARSWVSPRGAGVAVSMLLRPCDVARSQWSWLPLVAGIAVVDALDDLGVAARLKWPNDVLVGDRKIAGILVEIADRGTAAVVGIGLNLSYSVEDLPTPHATSIGLEVGRPVDPTNVLATLLRSVSDWYGLWRDASSDAPGDAGVVAAAYVDRSATLGQAVTVTLPDGASRTGVARAIDASGALVVTTDEGDETFASGDVVHVR